MAFRNICIVGPGAIGGMIGLLLQRAGLNVCALARPEKAAALKTQGVTLVTEGRTYNERLKASPDPHELGQQDLLLITVKSDGLAWAVPQLPLLSRPATPWVFVMNGVPWWFFQNFGGQHDGARLSTLDPDGALARGVPNDRMIWGVIKCSTSIRPDGVLVHNHSKDVSLGRADGGMKNLDDVAKVFAAAGYETEPTAHIRNAIWSKLLGNMTINPITALTQATVDVALGDPLVREFVVKVTDEGRAVGQALGLEVGPPGNERFPVGRKLSKVGSSMLTDVERGRTLELGPLLGAVIEIADLFGLPVPNTKTLFGLLRARALSAKVG